MALRFDRSSLRAPRTLADGTIVVEAVLTRTGVFDYGARGKEYRPESEVMKPESLASFEGMAVTDFHPPEGINLDNRKQYDCGSVVAGSVRRDGKEVIASLHITDKNLITAMKAGRVQVSCGYYQENINTPGTSPDGERYDAIQTKILGNHVAIVDEARAGESARVRMDSVTIGTAVERATMFKTIEEATAAYQAEKLRADGASNALEASKQSATAEKLRADQAEAARDAAKDASVKAEKLRVDGEKSAMVAARARVALETSACRVLRTDDAEEPDLTGKSDREIRCDVIAKISGKPVPADKSDAYIEARFDSVLETVSESDAEIAAVVTAVETGARNDGVPAAGKAYAEMVARNQNAWKSAQKGS